MKKKWSLQIKQQEKPKMAHSQGLLLAFAWMIGEDCLLLRHLLIKLYVYEKESYNISTNVHDGIEQ